MKNIIIFSGYNQRAVIAFLRTLEKNRICNYAIIAASEQDMILHTAYADKVLYIRKKKQLDLQEIIEAVELVCKFYNEMQSIIVPSTEALNRFMLSNRSFFEQIHCEIPLPNKELYEAISDKESFWKLCRNNEIKVPEIVNITTEYNVPIVAKPKKYFSQNGNVYSPLIIKSEESFNDFVNNYPISDFDCQEYVEGESYYLLYYFDHSEKVYKFSQKNFLQQEGGKSIIAAECSNLHLENDIALKFEKMFLDLNYRGLVMVEIRKRGREFYMIEANPRFWGPSQLFCDAGYNFFEFFLYDYGIIKQISEINIDLSAKYFWSGGINNCNYVCHAGSETEIKSRIGEFYKNDIYNRKDTKKIFEYESRS